MKRYSITDWLPTSAKEVKAKGWDELDVILFSGDAYIDHPSFGAAVIGRIIEHEGLKVAIVPQPNWQDDLRDFKKLGIPKLFFAVTAGNMDSMVNHYTANKRLRSEDAYTAGKRTNLRPDYPTIIYSNILKELYPQVPIVIGGIEASLRRLSHYDYWQDKLKPSILIDSKADLLVYGMGELPLKEILRLLKRGVPFKSLTNIPQTSFIEESIEEIQKIQKWNDITLSSHQECLREKKKFARNFKFIEEESNKIEAGRLLQKTHNKWVVVNPPFPTMSSKQLDSSFDLPFTRLPHPRYRNKGAIPAYEMIKHSINIHRGCFGGCSFCTISAHQGKFITNRSEKSIMQELEQIVEAPDFKGHITDIGGPSANMYKMKGVKQEICNSCKRPSCIFPSVCNNLETDHKAMTELYRRIRNHPKVKKATIGSGIRYDMLFDKQGKISKNNFEYTQELIKHHVSGRLKVAPEHTSDRVLKIMRKPSFSYFYKFKKIFDRINKEERLNQQLIPYFISSHPGSELLDMAELSAEVKELNFRLEQIQDFTPTPMTVATVIFYSGYHPFTMEKIFTAKSRESKLRQRQFFFWYKKEYRNKIQTDLKKLGRKDLIQRIFSKG